MARTCKKTNVKLEELRAKIKEFAETVNPGSKDYQNRLDLIRLAYTGPGGLISEKDFNKVLNEFQIDSSNVQTEVKKRVTQLQNQSLSYNNISTIYRNATSALGFMKHDFQQRMFKAIFIDNTNYGELRNSSGKLLNDVVRRIPTTKIEVNANIAKMKNELIKLIADYFNLPLQEDIFVYAGNQSKVNIQAYQDLLKNEKVVSWLYTTNQFLQTASSDVLKIHSALFILNNFDTLVDKYLNKIIEIPAANKGDLENFEYVKEFEGNAPSIWSVDDLVTYGSDLYASNLGKFILSTINKVDSNSNPIEGTFMTSQDSFVLAALLKEAEYEYHVVMKNSPDYNPELSIRINLTQAVKTLMELGLNDKLNSLKNFKKEIRPVYNWLYNTSEKTIGIETIQKQVLDSGQVVNVTSILNLENVLVGEIVKNVAPTYLEYNTTSSNPVRTINVSHTFRGTSYITNNLKAQIFDEFKLDYSDQNPILSGKIIKDSIQKKTLNQILTDNTTESQAFLDLFELLFGEPLSESLIQNMPVSEDKAKPYIEDVLFKIGDFFRASLSYPEENREFEFAKIFDQTFLKKESDFKNKYSNITQTIADRKNDLPLTVIRNSEGKAIPIYRLSSTIFEDSYLLSQLKKGRVNRGELNILVDNFHLLTSINNPNRVGGEGLSTNAAYQGSTGLKLETISTFGTNSANDSSAQEAYINSVLGDFIGLGSDAKGHSISVQLMTLSDKASIFSKIVNLDALISFKGQQKSLDQMSNKELEELYYHFRKNQIVDEMFHIIETWNKLLDLNLRFPDINEELVNTREMLPTTEEFIRESWKKIKDEFANRQLKKASQLEQVLRDYKKLHPNESINLVKDLHFSTYNKELALNKNIYYHFKQIRSVSNFSQQINDYVLKNLTSAQYRALNTVVKNSSDLLKLVKDYCDTHFEISDIKLTYNPEYPIGSHLITRKLLLDNFLRSQLLDLHFKGPQLDAVKKIPNYDEESDPELLGIIEADSKFKAAGKRTVDLPGTKQNFAQGLIDGVSEEVNVAHIEEPEESVFNPLGQEDYIEVLNGSGRISYIYAMMESASMTGSPFRGINRKTLGEHVDDFYSTLYKWAEYLINNWHMRNSSRSKYQLEQLFRKMHNISFDEDINLTKTFLNPSRHFTPTQANDGESVFFAKGLHYYKLVDMLYRGDNTYDLIIKEVNDHGDELLEQRFPEELIQTKNVKIQNLFDLFNVLGGIESMIKGKDGLLEYSDQSLKALFNYVINIGEVIDPSATKYDQKSVRQPLRDKFIAIAASTSGIKRGETNTNSKKVYTNKDIELLTSKIRTALFGAQMDVYHHIDDESEATEPSQTLAALATNGNTREEANRVYTAISNIIKSNMKAVMRVQKIPYDEKNAQQVLSLLTKEIIAAINDGGTDLQQTIVELCQTYLGNLVPVSDILFYNAFHMYNIKELNKLALRRKYSGLGGVLNPSSNSYQLFRVGTQDIEYDDLVKRARKLFNEFEDVLNSFSTRQIANLYLYSKTTKGKKDIWDILKEAQTDESYITSLKNMADAIEENLDVEEGSYTSEELFADLPSLVGVAMNKGDIDPLDTVWYKKDGVWYKSILDNCTKYFDFLMDSNIEEVLLDISIPHDLKPQIMKYSYDGEKHSLYDSEGGELSYLFNQMDQEELENILSSLDTDGSILKDQCEL